MGDKVQQQDVKLAAYVNTWTGPDRTEPEFTLCVIPRVSYLSTYAYIQRSDACLLKNIYVLCL